MYNLAVKFRAPFQKTEILEVIGAYITYNDQVSAVNFYCCSYVYIQDGNINDGWQLQYKAVIQKNNHLIEFHKDTTIYKHRNLPGMFLQILLVQKWKFDKSGRSEDVSTLSSKYQ